MGVMTLGGSAGAAPHHPQGCGYGCECKGARPGPAPRVLRRGRQVLEERGQCVEGDLCHPVIQPVRDGVE